MRSPTQTPPKLPAQPPISPITLADAIQSMDSGRRMDFVSLERRIGYDGLLSLLQLARQYVTLIKTKIKAEGRYSPLYANTRTYAAELEAYLNQRES